MKNVWTVEERVEWAVSTKPVLMLISKSNKVTRSNGGRGWKDVWCVHERRGYDCIVELPAPSIWQSNCAESRERCQYSQIGRVHLTRRLLLTVSWSITIESCVMTTLCIDMFVYRLRCASYTRLTLTFCQFILSLLQGLASWMRMETVNAEWPAVTLTLQSWYFIDGSLLRSQNIDDSRLKTVGYQFKNTTLEIDIIAVNHSPLTLCSVALCHQGNAID